MPEGSVHQDMCYFLLQLLLSVCGAENTAGSDQFLYFDASNPRRCCAPDGYVKLGVPQPKEIRSWKTWQHGTPELCVEILSKGTEEKLTLPEKLRRFHIMGVQEVVVLNTDAEKGTRLRAWDLIEGDLVERVVEHERTPCLTLGLWFVLAEAKSDRLDEALRLAHDPEGHDLVLSSLEKAERMADRASEAEAREAQRADRAEAEVAALQAELARLRDQRNGLT